MHEAVCLLSRVATKSFINEILETWILNEIIKRLNYYHRMVHKSLNRIMTEGVNKIINDDFATSDEAIVINLQYREGWKIKYKFLHLSRTRISNKFH